MSIPISRRDAIRGMVASAVTLVACEGTTSNRVSDDADIGDRDGNGQADTDGDSRIDLAPDLASDGSSDVADSGAADADASEALECETATGPQTEGPFYPGEPAVRMDITEGLDGLRLTLDLRVVARGGDCTPLADAEVDVWHADIAGDYSGYAQMGTEGETWMRGQQMTDLEGQVGFDTVIPGSYPGRAVHVHVKVRAPGRSELTTQVYFPDNIVAAALGDERYAEGASQTTNARDGFYSPDTLLEVTGDASSGYRARGVLVIG